MVGLLGYLDSMVFPPRFGPEWGSGGIFGLKYYKGVLYFTLAFEAVANFTTDHGVKKYSFDLVGPSPRSGGDTYNAVEAVDEYIYFGGWVHSPAIYVGRETIGAQISFKNKFSHVHAYNVYEDEVKLLWKEGLEHEMEWVGEVSEIIYDPINDRLLFARGDGMVNLGVYQINRRGGDYKKLSDFPAQKGSYFYDHVCFDMFKDWVNGVVGIQCVDLVENKIRYLELGDIRKRSLDSGDAILRLTGVATSAYGRFFTFIRGGILIGNPIDETIEPISFYRLFDFGYAAYSPRRTMAKTFAGGILTAFNSYSEAIIKPTNEYEVLLARSSNTIVGPSVLLYIAPPTVKIIATLGARITGFEIVEDKIVLAYNNMANTFRYDATPIDAGFRGFMVLDHDIVHREPPPVRFNIKGFQVGCRTFGGIPLTGYKEPTMKILSNKNNKLYVYEYDLSLPPTEAQQTTYSLTKGVNIVELKNYKNSIVSFRLDEEDPQAIIKIDLI
ncbi:MAG: DUF2139 domain-containing protein [Ignisphaera sp.]|uniref:DUF2139 domain-containing protein n=1 Tax=Ignisphaera aggregans TaxID=334771 RepID=A0A7C4NLZ3_9CREN